MEEIKRFLEQRGITGLYHFTRVDNLEGILEEGIRSRIWLEKNIKGYNYNDSYRLDGRLDMISVSISFPNYKMFWKYRNEDKDCEWCVIELDSKVLYSKDCIFCRTNAASTEETRRPIIEKIGVNGLNRLFYNEIQRNNLRLQAKYTTDPQAEVLVKDVIETDYIKGLYFDREKINFPVNLYKDKYKFRMNKNLFSYRNDFEEWR